MRAAAYHVAALDIASFAQALVKRAHAARPPAGRCAAKKTDHRHPLLHARRERPRGCRAAEQRDEFATFQLNSLHSVPASQCPIAGYRIGEEQSAAAPPTIFQDLEDVRPEGAQVTGSTNARPRWG